MSTSTRKIDGSTAARSPRLSVAASNEPSAITRTSTTALTVPTHSIVSPPSTRSSIVPINSQEQEAVEIEDLFRDIDWHNSDLAALQEQWRAELAQIETENVTALMESSTRGQNILPLLHRAIEEVSAYDSSLTGYCEKLQIMGREIQQIEELNRGLNIQTHNQQLLLAELDEILSRISLSDDILRILENEPLEVPQNVPKIEAASTRLHQIVSIKFEDGMQKIKAVEERLEFYKARHIAFVQRLKFFFISSFSTTKEHFMASRPKSSSARGSIHLSSPDEHFAYLSQYSGLCRLMREMDPRQHAEILNAYQTEMSHILYKEVDDISDTLRQYHLIKVGSEQRPFLKDRTLPSERDFTMMRLLDTDSIPDLETSERMTPAQTLHFLILIYANAIEQHRNFCKQIFFGLKNRSDVGEQKIDRLVKYPCSILVAIFVFLGEYMQRATAYLYRHENVAAVDMLAVIDQRLSELGNRVPLLAGILKLCQSDMFRYCQEFLHAQITAIEDYRLNSSHRTGMFPFVPVFPKFVAHFEKSLARVSSESLARNFAKQMYEEIGNKILNVFRSLKAMADKRNEKDLINVAVMTIENTHYLSGELRQLKVSALDSFLKITKDSYQESLDDYAYLSLRRILGRLLDFFEQIEELMSSISPEEIAFRTNFNKAAAQKVLAQYPAKEVKKNIELLHSRVVKHFSNNNLLLQVVWRHVQNEFLQRCNRIREDIGKVYPSSTDVVLSFSANDLQAFFAEVAKR